MLNLRYTLFVWLLLCLCKSGIGQQQVKGTVLDKDNGEPLPFVQVIPNNDHKKSVLTDIDGRFVIQYERAIQTLSFDYIWYEHKEIHLSGNDDKSDLQIRLTSNAEQLGEVVILPSENPANRIIRAVMANKDKNDPEKLKSYAYRSYNKVIYDMTMNDSLIMARRDSILRGGHMMIMESIAEKKFKAPDLEEEVIIATRISGFKQPSFGPLATDLQPFTFYTDHIPILDVNYLNPIANGSLRSYRFQIEDTILNPLDTTFILSFEPRKGKNFEGLKGLLYINTNGFGIQNVLAAPYEPGLIDIKIQQEYTFVEPGQWFPKELLFEITLMQEPETTMGITLNGRSYISEVRINPDFSRKDFGIETVRLGQEANDKDSSFWKQQRDKAINEKEEITYKVVDSLGTELKFDKIMTLAEKVGAGKVPVKMFDLDLTKAIIQNTFEGYRVGIGISTNELVSEKISVGGYYGYGLKDKRSKFGGHFRLNLSERNEATVRGSYENTLREVGSGSVDLGYQKYSLRNYMASRMDATEAYRLEINFRTMRYFKVRMGMVNETRTPLYTYQYNSDSALPTEPAPKFAVGELHIGFRFAYREKLIQSLGQRLSLGTKFPILQIHYSRSEKGLLNAGFTYNKLEAVLEDDFLIRKLGKTTIRVEAGYIDRPLPYTYLFTGEGSFVSDRPLIVEHYFQTIAPYDFLSDRQVTLDFAHEFGTLLFNGKKFKPKPTVRNRMSWGTLANPDKHEGVAFQTKEKGLYEAGLQLDDLVRINYFNVAYLGIGVGVFYRYGPYQNAEPMDNVAFKLSFSYSSK